MPPQQSERLLDFGDDGFDFGAHIGQVSGIGHQGSGVKLRCLVSIISSQRWRSAVLIPDA
jgi:hypothetical protein